MLGLALGSPCFVAYFFGPVSVHRVDCEPDSRTLSTPEPNLMMIINLSVDTGLSTTATTSDQTSDHQQTTGEASAMVVDDKTATLENDIAGKASPPAPTDVQVLVPMTIEDKIKIDSAQEQKNEDDVSLIVHVDDTSDLDYDLLGTPAKKLKLDGADKTEDAAAQKSAIATSPDAAAAAKPEGAAVDSDSQKTTSTEVTSDSQKTESGDVKPADGIAANADGTSSEKQAEGKTDDEAKRFVAIFPIVSTECRG